MDKLSTFLVKFADNAHLGKIATDFAPGIILTTTILLLLGSFSELEIFPYAKKTAYQARTRRAEKAYNEVKTQLEKIQTEVDSLEADLENQSPPSAERDQTSTTLARLRKVQDRLKTENAEKEKQWLKLQEEERKIYFIGSNLDVIYDNVIVLFFSGYFLGLILAQVSGQVFYNGVFYKYFKNNPKLKEAFDTLYRKDNLTITHFQMKAKDEAINDRLEKLEINYFRFMEIAMNMILPFLVLTLTLLVIGIPNGNLFSVILATASFSVMIGLYFNARGAYVGYSLKKADIMKLLLDQTNISTNPVS